MLGKEIEKHSQRNMLGKEIEKQSVFPVVIH